MQRKYTHRNVSEVSLGKGTQFQCTVVGIDKCPVWICTSPCSIRKEGGRHGGEIEYVCMCVFTEEPEKSNTARATQLNES